MSNQLKELDTALAPAKISIKGCPSFINTSYISFTFTH